MGLSLMNMLALLSSVRIAFVLYTSPLSVQALQSRSCLSYAAYAITAAQSQSQNHAATDGQSVCLKEITSEPDDEYSD
jgi:hypothetical protein